MSKRDFYTDIDLNNQKVINSSDPVDAQDVATKAYVDANAGGSGHLLRLDDTAPTAITDDVYTGGDFYLGDKVTKLSRRSSAASNAASNVSISDIDNAVLDASSQSVLLGTNTLGAQTSVARCVVIGESACSGSPDTASLTDATVIGPNAGNSAATFLRSVIVGNSAALGSAQVSDAVVIGGSAARDALDLRSSVAVGTSAGRDASSFSSFFGGIQAGQGCTGSLNVSLGRNAGQNSSGDRSIFLGDGAGSNCTVADAVGIGDGALNATTGTQPAIAIGKRAGQNMIQGGQVALGNNALNSCVGFGSIGIGTNAGQNSFGEECFYLGANAGVGNEIGSTFIVSENVIQSYANKATAEADLTTANGAVLNQVHWYMDESDNTIKWHRVFV